MAALEVQNVTFSYDDETPVIQNIDLTLRKGELVSLIGVSGCGKTTLFNVIAGINKPQQGKVLLNGRDVTGKTGNISYMLQKDMLLPFRTVVDNVALPLILKGIPKRRARETAGAYFAQFGIEGTQKQYPAQLSGGMRQRAALLRTYLFSSEVALLDEPFSALDTLTKLDMHRWYLKVMDEIKLSTIFITHDIDEAVMLSDRVYLLGGKPGTITKEIVICEPKPRREDFILTEAFLDYKRQIISTIR